MSHDMLHVMVQSLAEQKIFLFSKTDCLWHPHCLLDNEYHGVSPQVSRQGVKLTTHLQLVPGLRVSGAIPLLHPYA